MAQGRDLWLSHLRNILEGGNNNPYLLMGVAPLESKRNILQREVELRSRNNFDLPKKYKQALKMLLDDEFKSILDLKVAKAILENCAYRGLGLEPLDDANADQIKAIFRRLSLTHHPDRGGDPTKFLQISESKSRLLDDDVFRVCEDSALRDAMRVIRRSEGAIAGAAAPLVAAAVVAAAAAPVVAVAPAPAVAVASAPIVAVAPAPVVATAAVDSCMEEQKQSNTEISTSNLGEEKAEAW